MVVEDEEGEQEDGDKDPLWSKKQKRMRALVRQRRRDNSLAGAYAMAHLTCV